MIIHESLPSLFFPFSSLFSFFFFLVSVGDKIGAMAEAVENADMVIACITRGYQDSQDCRTGEKRLTSFSDQCQLTYRYS